MTPPRWRASTHSFSNGNCAEIASWRNAADCDGGACIQVGCGHAVIGVRDSRDPGGPVLEFTPAAWRAFLATI